MGLPPHDPRVVRDAVEILHGSPGSICRWPRILRRCKRARRRHNSINLVAKYRSALKTLRGIYIDCGWRDQYHIHYGARLLSARLSAAGVRHTYEEFDDNHSDVDYRMDWSLPFLTKALR